jgi:hypothetical protein
MFLALLALVVAVPAAVARPAHAASPFKVLAFYDGTYDAAHISFDHEANAWFPQQAAANGFTYTSTTDWSQLNTANLANYQVVMFLDNYPHTAAQQSAFQTYMNNGGGFIGFHVSAWNSDTSDWPWYHNTFLGTGVFETNSWGPTSETLKIEDRNHPATAGLPATITSPVSEWYSWQNDLRQNPDIQILASVDPSSFPLGTDPNQSWYSGYYPILWTNKNFKMLYANFGHDAMNYDTKTPLSSTFADPVQDKFIIDGLLWLGGAAPSDAPADQINPNAYFSVVNKGNSKCVDARGAGTANGTVLQQYTCNATNAQQFQFQWTNGPYLRVNNRGNTAESWDVTNRSTADNAGIQLWSFSNGTNQQWQAVQEGSGYWHFVNMSSQKCLTASGSADSTQLTQVTCTGVASQSFRLQQQS